MGTQNFFEGFFFTPKAVSLLKEGRKNHLNYTSAKLEMLFKILLFKLTRVLKAPLLENNLKYFIQQDPNFQLNSKNAQDDTLRRGDTLDA